LSSSVTSFFFFLHRIRIADFCRYIAELEDNELLTANSSNQPSSSFKIKPIAHRSTSDIVLNTSSFAFPTLSSADLAAACLAQPTHAAHSAYNAALIRSQSLSPINIVRLGLALNASIFFHDTMKSPDNACKLAKSAFDAANAELGQRDLDIEAFEQVSLLPVLSAGSNPQQNDSVLLEECRIIMRKLRSNLVAWTLEDIEDS
jgi:14-3-3 protein epsilon